MRPAEEIAEDVIDCTMSLEQGARVAGNVTAEELRHLAESMQRWAAEIEGLRDALRVAETTRNAAQEIATRETERARDARTNADRWHTYLSRTRCRLDAHDGESAEAAAMRVSEELRRANKRIRELEKASELDRPAFEKRTATGTLMVRAGDVLEGVEGRTTTRILVVYVSEETLLARQLWSRRADGMAVGDPGRESTWTLSCRDWRKVEEGHDHG